MARRPPAPMNFYRVGRARQQRTLPCHDSLYVIATRLDRPLPSLQLRVNMCQT